MESDYKMLMMILSKNMSEGSDERAVVQPVVAEKAPSSKLTLMIQSQCFKCSMW